MERRRIRLLPSPPLLLTESADKFATVRSAFEREIRPRGIVEDMYVDEIACIVWELLRLRRCKTIIINMAYRQAILEMLPLRFRNGFGEITPEGEALADNWFRNASGKREVSKILGELQLDESAIEAAAIRIAAKDLELLDRMQASLEARRNRALRCIADYRNSLAIRLRESANRMLEAEDLVQLQDATRKRKAA